MDVAHRMPVQFNREKLVFFGVFGRGFGNEFPPTVSVLSW